MDTKVYILNGGLKAWRFVRGKTKSGPEKIIKTKYKVGRIKNKLKVTYEDLLHLKNKKISILDARPKKRFFET